MFKWKIKGGPRSYGGSSRAAANDGGEAGAGITIHTYTHTYIHTYIQSMISRSVSNSCTYFFTYYWHYYCKRSVGTSCISRCSSRGIRTFATTRWRSCRSTSIAPTLTSRPSRSATKLSRRSSTLT